MERKLGTNEGEEDIKKEGIQLSNYRGEFFYFACGW